MHTNYVVKGKNIWRFCDNFFRSFYSRNFLSGFTLIELLVAISIIGVLAGEIVITLNPTAQIQKARNAQRKNDLYQIQYALANFDIANGKYPETLPFGSAWGTYMGFVPNDPNYPSKKYAYSVAPDEQSYYLYASLDGNENNNIECNGGICTGTDCGSGEGSCNHGVSNTGTVKECKIFPANCTNSSDHGCCEGLGYTCQYALIGGWKCRLSSSPTATPSSTFTPAPTSTPTQTATCTDSDRGKVYNTKGTCVDGNGISRADICLCDMDMYKSSCLADSSFKNKLNEYSCDPLSSGGLSCRNDIYDCPNGCSNGACLPVPTSTPTPIPCQVTTSPASLNWSTYNGYVPGTVITATVTSGLGSATVNLWTFGTYNTDVATVDYVFQMGLTKSLWSTIPVKGIGPGSTSIWAVANLSDGRICPTTRTTNTDINIIGPAPTCQVTTSPASYNLAYQQTAVITATVTSGLGSAKITQMMFDAYHRDIANLFPRPFYDSSSPYSVPVKGDAEGITSIFAVATLSDGRTCRTTEATDTDLNVAGYKRYYPLPPTPIP